MKIIGERKSDGQLIVGIGDGHAVYLDPSRQTVSRPHDLSSMDRAGFEDTDNSLERRRAVQRQLDRATLTR